MCKTNVSSSTAFRGFGAVQAVMAIENVMTDISTFLHMDPHKVSGNIVTVFVNHNVSEAVACKTVL